MIKSLPEIEVMRQAAAITSAGFAAAVAAIRAGALDNDVARAAYDTIIGAGGEDFSLQPIVTSGRRSGIPHSTFHRTPLKEGDVLLLELSTAYQRYDVHAMRTASIGEPPVAVRRAFDACLASVESLLQNIRGGASAREVARKAGGRLRAMEPDLMWHGCYGYSMGLTFPPACTDCIDGSVISEHADATLQPGMVLHCSTSLRNIGQYGTAVGECVLVTDDGCEILTQFPRELNGRAKAQLRE
jgi:Xaa-Pro aminopeptidase